MFELLEKIRAYIQGTQLLGHYGRMSNQAVKLTIFSFIGFFVAIFITISYLRFDFHDLKSLNTYSDAIVAIFLNKENRVLDVKTREGDVVKVTAREIKEFPYIKILFKRLVINAVWAFSLGFILTIFFAILLTMRNKERKKGKVLRGQKLISKKELIKQITKYNKKKKWKDSFDLSGVPYPADSERYHTILFGSTGSGKTVLLSHLVEQIQARGEKMLIVDKMGDFTEKFFREGKDKLLNPFDERTERWNILNEASCIGNFDSVAEAMIPHRAQDAQPYFSDAARTVFSEICKNLYQENKYISNKDIVDTILKQDFVGIAKRLEGTIAHSFITKDAEEQAAAIMSTLVTFTKGLQHLKDDEAKPIFSIRKWIEDEVSDSHLYLHSGGESEIHKTLVPLISTWVEIAINRLSSAKNRKKGELKQRVWLIIDELYAMHKLPSLIQGLTEIRQYGGCVVLAVQSISHLISQYGTTETKMINGLCHNRVLLSIPDIETAKWCSEGIGQQEVEEYHEGISYGAHEMRDGVSLQKRREFKNVIIPEDMMLLDPLEGYIKMRGTFPIAKLDISLKDWPIKNEVFKNIFQGDFDMREKEIARKMLDKKISKEAIKNATGLSIENIISIEENK